MSEWTRLLPMGWRRPIGWLVELCEQNKLLIRGTIQLALFVPAGLFYAFKVGGREPTTAFRQFAFVALIAAGMLFLV